MNLYIVTNKVNGKQYVGITSASVRRRWTTHLLCARNGSRLPFHHAIRKYGADSFIIECAATAESYQQLCALERCFIDALGTKSPDGYNATDGGEGALGYRHTPSAKAKLAALHSNPSAERRAQLSAIWLGRKRSPETRAKMSEANRKRPPLSAESRAKMAESARRRHALNRSVNSDRS